MFGYEEKQKFFKSLVNKNALGHAYLFFGDEGVGKRYFALGLANFLENKVFDCEAGFPLIDARVFKAEEGGSLGVAEALKIRSFLWETPLKSRRRFAIVENADSLTIEAQSALLKVVEESPEFALIVFIGKNVEIFLSPLASRLTKVYFGRISDKEISKALASVYNIDNAKAEVIAKNSFGRIGRAFFLAGKLERDGKESSLLDKISDRIVSLRNQNLIKNFKQIKHLLQMENSLSRYNLNENLQKKALEYLLDTKF